MTLSTVIVYEVRKRKKKEELQIADGVARDCDSVTCWSPEVVSDQRTRPCWSVGVNGPGSLLILCCIFSTEWGPELLSRTWRGQAAYWHPHIGGEEGLASQGLKIQVTRTPKALLSTWRTWGGLPPSVHILC